MARHDTGSVGKNAAQQRPIVLVGFMGAGKSTVGKALAERLGWPFVDLDDVIEQNAGMTIGEIFKSEGEIGFRAKERAALRDVLKSAETKVIACGGGTFIDGANRKVIGQEARSVYLRAQADTLMARLESARERQKRPLLGGHDYEDGFRRLLNERQSTYEEAEFTLHTDGRGILDVVEEICRVLRVGGATFVRRDDGVGSARRSGAKPTVQVKSSDGDYEVILRRNKGPWLAQAICNASRSQRYAVITDSTVKGLHAEAIVRHLEGQGKQVSLHVFAAGEESKTLSTVETLYDSLLEAGVGRKDTLVAVGGGVCGDMTGFVAATLLRGVPYVQVPTTTLAAVDSSVGGKTAVNTKHGKNLVGAFYAPKAVLICAEHLATQSPRAHAAGLAEALKMAFTLEEDFFDEMVDQADRLLAFDSAVLLPAISRAVQLKAAVVARDEKEAGERAVLNYGHTIGHAIEAGENYEILHGEAVALGMVAEAQWAEMEGAPKIIHQALCHALQKFSLPTAWERAKISTKALGMDKKRVGIAVKVPVVPKVGSFEFRRVPLTALEAFLSQRGQRI